jgi:hypothetical protein
MEGRDEEAEHTLYRHPSAGTIAYTLHGRRRRSRGEALRKLKLKKQALHGARAPWNVRGTQSTMVELWRGLVWD